MKLRNIKSNKKCNSNYKINRAQSQTANGERLKKLRVKIECIDKAVNESKIVLIERLKNKTEEYKEILIKLMIQVKKFLLI